MPNHGTSMPAAPAGTQSRKPFRVADIAALLDVHPATVYRDIEAGRLRALRIGAGKGAIRILPDALAAYLELMAIPTYVSREVA